MKLRLISDMHTEFWGANNIGKVSNILEEVLPSLPEDKETTLVLAGDIGSLQRKAQYEWCLDLLCERFKHIVWVAGNHEWYGGHWVDDRSYYRGILDKRGIHHDYRNDIDGVTFICTTLWTDFQKENPTVMFDAERRMNDYRQIEGATPLGFLNEHKFSLGKIKEILSTKPTKSVVVTHHAPSFQSIHDDYRNDRLNAAYATDLEYVMLEHKPKFWFHGHVHMPKDYMVGETRVVCNPLGYRGYERTGHSKTLVLEV